MLLSGAQVPFSEAQVPSYETQVPLSVAQLPTYEAKLPPSDVSICCKTQSTFLSHNFNQYIFEAHFVENVRLQLWIGLAFRKVYTTIDTHRALNHCDILFIHSSDHLQLRSDEIHFNPLKLDP